MRLLVVEDDLLLGESLVNGLRREAYAVDWAKSVKDMEAMLAVTEAYSAILLDLNLPDGYGLEVLSRFRSNKIDTPVIIITARDAIEERIKGLDAGADDYIIKPFDIKEIFARLRSLNRRLGKRSESVIAFSDMRLDPASHTVSIGNDSILLKNKEFMLLQLLIENAERFVSKERIKESLYSWDEDIGSNTVEMHISNLRKKIGKNRIKMLRNIGYRLEDLSS